MRAEAAARRHTVTLDAGADADAGPALAVFGFGADTGAGDWRTGLESLGGDFTQEFWRGTGRVETRTVGACTLRCGAELVMAAVSLEDDGDADPAPLVRHAYRELYAAVAGRGPLHMVRLWNYLPHINDGEGDHERYRRFCVGRGEALSDIGIGEQGLCAGTAIGTRGRALNIYALAAPVPGVQIENPRQISAYRYPRQYGPCSPSFARATALKQPDGRVALMISGTASVVGHATLHPGDLDAQLGETAHNLDTLLTTAAQSLGRPALARFGPQSLLRVYLRDPTAWPRVRDRLRQAWPDARIAGLAGEICRRDLEVEIEAWHCG